ncbi:phosphotransferase family protein [Neobacillus sp. NPDC093182]|uniref:phosphotransferase family protein n=1 Tax=Neobacillus sp. NPDC093182 TaxID=3364297 RepID=UPI00381E4A67
MGHIDKNDTIPVRKGEDFDRKALRNYLAQHVSDFPNKKLEVEQFTTGLSNLTYFLRCGEWEAVMRRPPSGPLPPKAHDMKRESDLLTRLHPVFPLVPKPYVFCEDTEVLGAPFYVMERKQGVVLDAQFPPGFHVTKELRIEISNAVVDALAQLHTVEYEKAGLAQFGRPEGFLDRQVNSWIQRYIKYTTDEIPYFDKIAKWLEKNIPSSRYTSLLHNDYKLNNMLFSKDFTRIEAILDWEMATTADPFFDLGGALGYWLEPNDPDYLKKSLPTVTTEPGFIKRSDFIQRYALQTGFDIPPLNFYIAFTYFKLAVALQQIYYRWKVGQTKDNRFSNLIERVNNLMLSACEVAETGKY